MDLTVANQYLDAHGQGVLATLKRDGRPQLSNVMYSAKDGLVRISVTAERAKARNATRDPRVSLHVTAPDFWSYLVVEGDAELTPEAGESAETLAELRELYRLMSGGEHEDWDDYDRAMVADRRQVLHLRVAHAYGMVPPA